jgi:hypothetical protein
MPSNVKLNEDLGLIETIYSGCLTDDDVKDAATKALSMVPQGVPGRFLVDLSEVEDLKLTTLEIHSLPKRWVSLQADTRNKSAVLTPEAEPVMSAARFYETTCRNHGWNVRAFTQRQDAIDWLLG